MDLPTSRPGKIEIDEDLMAMARKQARVWSIRLKMSYSELVSVAYLALSQAALGGLFNPAIRDIRIYAAVCIKRAILNVFKREQKVWPAGQERHYPDMVVDPNKPVDQVELADTIERVRQVMKPREFEIAMARIGEGKKLHAIAAEYGISRERVRQIANDAVARCRTVLD